MKKLMSSIILSVLGFSCNPSSFDNYIDLGNGYTFEDRGGFRNMISPQNYSDKVFIFPDVVDYASDSIFILAEQRPNEKGIRMVLGNYLYARYDAYASLLKDPKYLGQMKGL